AVGGYLVAHLGGYLPWPTREPAPTPAAIQTAPSASGVVSKTPRAQPPQPVPPASADADEPRPTAAPDAGPAAKRPARTTVNATQAAPSHKPMTAGTAESKPITAGTDAPEGKPHEAESVEAQVRAALEKVDAHWPAPSDAAPQTVSLPPAPPAAAARRSSPRHRRRGRCGTACRRRGRRDAARRRSGTGAGAAGSGPARTADPCGDQIAAGRLRRGFAPTRTGDFGARRGQGHLVDAEENSRNAPSRLRCSQRRSAASAAAGRPITGAGFVPVAG